MKSPSIAYDNGEATTLMGIDAEILDSVTEMMHETWAQVIEVLVGIGLLARQVGWIWPLPLILIYSLPKGLEQRNTRSFSGNKLCARRIQELRKLELYAASKLGWIMVYYNASANALGIFSPAITLVIYAVLASTRGDALNTETAFTTMAILSMVTHPANMIMTIVPRAMAAFAAFERIQSFLLRRYSQASRGSLPPIASQTFSGVPGHAERPSIAIQIHELDIGKQQSILEKISIQVAAGCFTIVSGPTGSGKSTLLRAVLGEVTPSNGSVSVATRQIAYCSQKPWLPNGTIRDAIYGPTNGVGGIDRDAELWFQEVVDACCLTHDINSLRNGDQTQIGSRGLNLSGGQRQRVALARALFARRRIILLDDTFSGLDVDTEQTVFKNLLGSAGLLRRSKATVVLVSNSSQYFQSADHVVVLGNRRVIDQGKWQNIKVRASSIAKFASSVKVDKNVILSGNFDKLAAQLRARDETQQDLSRKNGDPALYGYYLGFIDGMNIFLFLATTMSYGFFIVIPQYWLQLWTESGAASTSFYVGGFLFLSTMSWAMTSAQMWSVLIRLAPQSGSRLHQRLLQIVASAPLSYFSETDNGSILNRFGQDVQLIDKQLPAAVQNVVPQIFKLLMQVILLGMAEKWLIVPFSICMVVVYLVEGLETIRSFGWTEAVIRKSVQSISNSQRPEFVSLCLQRWLSIVLDSMASAVATSVVAMAVALRAHVSGAQVGIALNIMLVANTTLLKLVENWTTLETSIGAVARSQTLEKTTPVEGGRPRDFKLAADWPSRGHIEFKNVTASYEVGLVALQNIRLTVAAGQKLVVIGRTGSGKSTLVLTLLRLLELQSGISQDPLLFLNESLRFNLDPDSSVSEDVLIRALAQTGLQSHFFHGGSNSTDELAATIKTPDVGEHPVLDQKLSLLQELSVGQSQLFALSRALVKAALLRHLGLKPVVVLDEVTSSLDTATESAIYTIIDDEFTKRGHTVIIVAHRLGVLEKHIKVGRDAVALLADGRLREVVRFSTSTTSQHWTRM
ncbi:ABC transporter [Drechmeria coniospora]|uniref:ABC transporter n=1 Tax=Drechmeria coniospora TaxID=98403 RepID=A0A151GPG3_DRECN|nr:ABC transporter [Drechmeria coniospora]KYK58951.1 ABC transporter [Drechmeria coniospora]